MSWYRSIAALLASSGLFLVAACGPHWYEEVKGTGPGSQTIGIIEGRQFCSLLVLGNYDEWRPAGYPLHVVAAYRGGVGTTLIQESEDANASFEFRVVAGSHQSYGYSTSQGALLVPPGPMKVTVVESHEEARWSFKCRTLNGDGGGT